MAKKLFSLMLAAAAAGVFPVGVSAMLAPVTESAAVGRTTDIDSIRKALESKQVRERLAAFGLTEAEIDSRLSRLSDKEVHQLAQDIKTLSPGGHDILAGNETVTMSRVLIVVLVVLLILLIV